jgi:hypothetical protein
VAGAHVGVGDAPPVSAPRPRRACGRRTSPPRVSPAAPRVARPLMRFILFGLLIALVVFAVSGGHVLFLPLLFLLPLGGGLFHRRTTR